MVATAVACLFHMVATWISGGRNTLSHRNKTLNFQVATLNSRLMTASLASFSFPTATLFGPGAISELPARLLQMGSRKPLVVTDPGLLQTKSFQTLANTLGSKQLGQNWELFHGVHTNPTEQDVVDAGKAFREAGCDLVFYCGDVSDLGTTWMRLLPTVSSKVLSK